MIALNQFKTFREGHDSHSLLEKEMDGMKKVRLVEEQIGYEELAVIENFSEDEITFELKRVFNKERKNKMALQ